MQNKRGQVTLFVILAILLVALVAGFFIFRSGVLKESIVPVSLRPVQEYFLSCVENQALIGLNTMQWQGGYLELPELEQGSYSIPFSSQLNFVGDKIPYWYYISGNNLPKEQIPTKELMENQLENFIEERMDLCGFENYISQGFEIEAGESLADVTINFGKVDISLKRDISIAKDEEKILLKNHKISVSSEFGDLYESAKKVYKYENENLFLERYAIDVLRLYAPVDGAEISCVPKTWGVQEIFNDVEEAIESNTLFLKKGKGDYFGVDIPVKEDVEFLTSKDWPKSLEVLPSEGNFLIAEPIGNQPGLGMLGFCYVPYHFVYSFKYPVLIQVKKGDEVFQFPIVVVIEKNNARKSLINNSIPEIKADICPYKNTQIQVETSDSDKNSIEADISYECLGETCYIGKTLLGTLKENFPQCSQGYIVVSAEGFEKEKYLFSTISEGNVQITLDRLYPLEIDLKLNGVSANNRALISFISEKDIQTIVYPDEKIIELSEGAYEIDVAVYESSAINLQATTSKQCLEVSSGLGGFLGLTQEKCFEVNIPEQTISEVISGGGKKQIYLLDSDLARFRTIQINSKKLSTPTTLEQLNSNYLLAENQGLEITFR